VTRDDLRDGLALIGASLSGDEEGARVIRDNADQAGLIDTLLVACDLAMRLLADRDGVTVEQAAGRLQEVLRTI